MHLNYFFLKKLCVELNETLINKRLSICFSQDKDEMVFGFCDENSEVYLKTVVSPNFSFINIIENYSRAKRNTVNLWTEIYDSSVINFNVFENERAISLALERDYQIVFKFFGNRPNILLYRGNKQIAIFNNNLLSDKDLELENFNRKIDFSKENFQNQNGDFKKMFVTFGKIVNEKVTEHFNYNTLSIEQKYDYLETVRLNLESSQKYFVGLHSTLPSLSLVEIDEIQKTFNSAIEALNYFYVLYQSTYGFAKQKENETKRLQKEISKTQNYLEELSSKEKELTTSNKNDEIANILMANLHTLKEGQESILLHNFYSNSEIIIKLKKDLSPQKNAENYYRKSKNEKLEIEAIQKNIVFANDKLKKLQAEILNVADASSNKELKQLLKSNDFSQTTNKKNDKAELFKVYHCLGYEILVGKNAKNNDLLTMQYAHKEDIWLHARDSPGSHVIIKTQNNNTVPKQVLEFAASLAANYSKRKNEKVVPVIYTTRKFVKKLKGFKDGAVKLDKESILMIEPLDI